MTEIATEAAADTVQPLDRQLRAARNSLEQEGQWRLRHKHRVGPGVTQDTVRHSEYWANLASQLHRHDLIDILACDESWEIEACVERVLHGGAQISIRKVHKRTSISDGGRVVDGIGEYVSEWRPVEGWCVIRVKDGTPMVQGFALEALAIAEWQRRQPRKAA